jgi:hypothetical protein
MMVSPSVAADDNWRVAEGRFCSPGDHLQLSKTNGTLPKDNFYVAKNDTLLLDGIIDDRVNQCLPSQRRDEAFEYFAFQQVLRDADLSHDEVLTGAVDGRDDGGIDGFFILVNGNLLADPSSFFWPKHGSQLTVYVITCKHHDTFKQSPVDNLVATVSEIFDLGLSETQLAGAYSKRLLRVREILMIAYRRLSPRLQNFEVRFVYASRGDSTSVGTSVRARANYAVEKVRELFGNVSSSFDFLGAAELVGIHRKSCIRTLELSFEQVLSRGSQYAVLCSLSDYLRFISDENGGLRRYMFDSNIRAFMGLNRVNEDISDTLTSVANVDFWWLNNGVTILADSACVVAKTIQIDEPQIVNGLQTSESIFRHFNAGGSDEKSRCVLVKVIVSDDASTRDAIIRATNNQTNVELASLHATDKIQRDIEDYMRRSGLYYERRKNFYISQGIHPQELVTPMYLASGFVSLVLKSPIAASKLKSKFMREPTSYERVFSENHPIAIWPQIAKILKTVDGVLNLRRPHGVGKGERFLKSWRQLTALLTIARITSTFSFTMRELADLQMDLLTESLIGETWQFILKCANDSVVPSDSTKHTFVCHVCSTAAAQYGLANWQVVEKRLRDIPTPALSEEFINRVDSVLPDQPWKPGIHREIAAKIGCSPSLIFSAIEQLVASRRRNPQKDGVVYDFNDNVIAVDPDRL